ncbi:FHA domain-containing protein, partial [Streptomyces niveus]
MPELVLEMNGRTWTLDQSRSYSLGRDPQGDLVIDDARVSWRHATISWGGRGWAIEDHGSTNGTYVQGQRIQRMEIGPGTAVRLGNATDGPRLNLSGAAAGVHKAQGAPPQQAPAQHAPAQPQPQGGPGWSPQQQPPQQQGWPPPHQQPPQHQQPQHGYVPQQHGGPGGPGAGGPVGHGGPGIGGAAGAPPVYGDRSPTTFHQLAVGRVMRIGRALENELVVSDLQVSRLHAEFTSTPDGRYQIRDLGSHNGTYVNGQPMHKSGTALIGPNDIVGVGHSTFRLVGDRLEEFVDTGEVSFSARHLTVTVDGGKQIL